MADVVIIGAGIVGAASALALAARGARVTVLERSGFGEHAASTRAAGILSAQLETHDSDAMSALCVAGRDRWACWGPQVAEESGIDLGYAACGALRLAYDAGEVSRLEGVVTRHRARGLYAEMLEGPAIGARQPALSETVVAALWFPEEGVVDPPRLLEAVRRAAERRGARFVERAGVVRIRAVGDRVSGVDLASGESIAADVVVLAAGCRSGLVVGDMALPVDAVTPSRGQIFELSARAGLLTCVVEDPDAYLSPRRDGRVLVGSTVEQVGFEEGVTAGAAALLIAAAIRIAPALSGARLSASWSGLRPRTPDGLPLLGRGSAPGLIIATGHFRNGLLLAPISADVVTALVYGESPPIDVSAFDPARLTTGGTL